MKQFKLLSLILTLALLLTCTTNYVRAEPVSSDNLEADFESNETGITLKWHKGESEKFLVVNEKGETIYIGNDSIYSHKTESQLNHYYILRLDANEKVTDTYFISASKTASNKESDKSLVVNASVTKNNINLKWNGLINATQYQIYKNGNLIKRTNGSNFVDTDIVPDTEYRYDVKTIVNGREFTTVKFVKTLPLLKDETSQSFISALGTVGMSYKLRYTTFIPVQYAPAPTFWNYSPDGIKYFHGDNRGFSSTSSAYRTKVEVYNYFSGTDLATNSMYTDISPTIAYDANYNWLATKTASGGMTQSVWYKTYDEIKWWVSHSVGNPFVTFFGTNPAAIDYNFRAELNSAGKYLAYGDHDKAPSHEVYLTINGIEKTLYTFVNQGFENLAPNTMQASWRVSN